MPFSKLARSLQRTDERRRRLKSLASCRCRALFKWPAATNKAAAMCLQFFFSGSSCKSSFKFFCRAVPATVKAMAAKVKDASCKDSSLQSFEFFHIVCWFVFLRVRSPGQALLVLHHQRGWIISYYRLLDGTTMWIFHV